MTHSRYSLRLAVFAWLASIGTWTLIGTLFVAQELVFYHRTGTRYSLGRVLAEHGIEWGTWAALTPVLAAFVHHVPLTRAPRRRTASLYALAALLVVFGSVALIALGRYLLPWHDARVGFSRVFAANVSRLFAYSVVLFVLVAAASAAFGYYREARERELAGARLRSQLAAARTDALTMQLQPHFLFNTLNTIAGLVHIDARKADRMITGLSALLRTSLRADRPTFVPLETELEFVRQYLDIQQTRFDERLRTRFDVPAALHDAHVPTFVLQPLVENTVHHAVARHSRPVTVTIAAWRDAGDLHLRVHDDGPGLVPSTGSTTPDRGGRGGGIGLANTQARLRELYGARHRFDVRDRAGGGVEAEITLPYTPLPTGGMDG